MLSSIEFAEVGDRKQAAETVRSRRRRRSFGGTVETQKAGAGADTVKHRGRRRRRRQRRSKAGNFLFDCISGKLEAATQVEL